jgi:hypothetical protein
MIPTRLRLPIGKNLSYPVGAEFVSAQLSDVPQFSSLSISFHPFYGATPPIRLPTQAYLPAVAALYCNLPAGISASNDFIARGYHDETWELDVYPVPRPAKARIRSALASAGFPRLRQWLATERSPTWRIGRHRLTLLVDPSSGLLAFDEGGG